MKIVVDWSLCDGNGVCAKVAPNYFKLDDDDELQLLQETVDKADFDTVHKAVKMCPKAALRVADEKSAE